MEAAPATPPAGVVPQALKAAGAIDRQLRAERGDGSRGRQDSQESAAPSDNRYARLNKGFAAAHAAVGPKWFEAARTELISAPNDPKRIYRVTTATGEYCLYFPDKANMATNLDPKSGWAGFGQPKASTCPIPF